MSSYISLGPTDLAIASVLVLIDAGLSVALGLGIHRSLLIAAVRMTAQLAIMAALLTLLFSTASPVWTALAVTVMLAFAGNEIRQRQQRRFEGWWGFGLGTGAITAASLAVTCFALVTAIRPEPWYNARYAIPLLGMILGNCMTGVALGLDSLGESVFKQRAAIEARLLLGGTRWQALQPVVQASLRRGLMPVVNAMSATGVVALPGMMTGQILGGVPPSEAVKYQILVMFLIAGGTGFGTAAAVLAGVWRLTDGRHRLREDRLRDA